MIFKGRPIIKTECGNKNWVFVGRIPFEFNGKTFHDFLIQFLKTKLGYKWLQEQSKLSDNEQHIILRWFKEMGDLQKNATVDKHGLFQAPLNGSAASLLKLAYYLFLVGNNAKLEEIMLKRLRDKRFFHGAMYELFVFSVFVYAGYNIELENEQDLNEQHPEFVATNRRTGNKYSVEAKLRNKKETDSVGNINIWTQLTRALKKQFVYSKIIFIDANCPLVSENEMHQLFDNIDRQVDKKEQDADHVDEAFLFVTNNPYHFRPWMEREQSAVLIRGFRKSDYHLLFQPISSRAEFIRFLELRDKYNDLLDIHTAFGDSIKIPDYFGGDIEDNIYKVLPVLGYSIKRVYETTIQGKKVSAILDDYIIDEVNEELYLIFKNGTETFVDIKKLSANDIINHKDAQQKFIESQQKNVINGKTMLEIYDWLYVTYSQSTKEKLVEFLEPYYDKKELESKTQPELARICCVGWAESMYFAK